MIAFPFFKSASKRAEIVRFPVWEAVSIECAEAAAMFVGMTARFEMPCWQSEPVCKEGRVLSVRVSERGSVLVSAHITRIHNREWNSVIEFDLARLTAVLV